MRARIQIVAPSAPEPPVRWVTISASASATKGVKFST